MWNLTRPIEKGRVVECSSVRVVRKVVRAGASLNIKLYKLILEFCETLRDLARVHGFVISGDDECCLPRFATPPPRRGHPYGGCSVHPPIRQRLRRERSVSFGWQLNVGQGRNQSIGTSGPPGFAYVPGDGGDR